MQVYGGWTATNLLHNMSMTNGSQNWESKPTMRIHVQIVPSLGLSGLKGVPLSQLERLRHATLDIAGLSKIHGGGGGARKKY